jgi:hypothetical protein
VKEKKGKEILIRQESRHSCRPDVLYFLHTVHFLKTILLPPHIAHIAITPQASSETNALSKNSVSHTLYYIFLFKLFLFLLINHLSND